MHVRCKLKTGYKEKDRRGAEPSLIFSMKLHVGVYVSTCVTCRNGALITASLHLYLYHHVKAFHAPADRD